MSVLTRLMVRAGSVAATVAFIIVGTAAPGHASTNSWPPCDGLDPAAYVSDPSTPASNALGGTFIDLRYSPSWQCAWGRVSIAYTGGEVWVDRSSDRGNTWEPQLGFNNQLQRGDPLANGQGYWYNGYTTMWDDQGVMMRACGRAYVDGYIVCTAWF